MAIRDNKLENVKNIIEKKALLDEVKMAISKKIDKMKNNNEDFYEWFTYWLIISKDNNNGIGFVVFKGTPDEDGYSEIGYSIFPNYRKNGLMTEAVSLLINWASEFSDCKGITATKVLKTNIGSNRVLKICNFKLVNSLIDHNDYIKIFLGDDSFVRTQGDN